MLERLHIYYTNDLHSNFSQWPRVEAFLQDKRENARLKGEDNWTVDIGDHLDRVHPIAEAFMGQANTMLLNDAKYDVVTLGNNEGITLSHDDLYHLYDRADFKVVCANLHDLAEPAPEWLQNHTVLTSTSGIKMGVIGLTAPFNDYYELLDWHVSDPFSALEKELETMKQDVDVVILLSHLGLSDDQAIARRFPAIDVIIGGHTHHLLRTGEMIDSTILTAAGKHCHHAGEVTLTWDHAQQKLIQQEAVTTDIDQWAKDLTAEKKLQNMTDQANQRLAEVITHLNQPIEIQWFQDTPIMEKLTETMQVWTKADVAMLNAGLLLDRLGAGDVTYRDVHRICPHPINPCVVELTGEELTVVVRASFTKDLMELQLKGFGFRGELIGRMTFAGIDVQTKYYQDGHESVVKITKQGHELDADKTYTVAVADTFTFGRLLPEVAKSETKNYYLPEFMRDLLAYTLKKDFANEAD